MHIYSDVARDWIALAVAYIKINSREPDGVDILFRSIKSHYDTCLGTRGATRSEAREGGGGVDDADGGTTAK